MPKAPPKYPELELLAIRYGAVENFPQWTKHFLNAMDQLDWLAQRESAQERDEFEWGTPFTPRVARSYLGEAEQHLQIVSNA
jgi:hypothetical protein